MTVTVYKLEVLGSRAAKLYKALADGKLTEFRVQQAVERALDELLENPEFKNVDLGLEVAAEDGICSVCSQPSGLCNCATNSP